jgi:hypothetical protein
LAKALASYRPHRATLMVAKGGILNRLGEVDAFIGTLAARTVF